MAKLQQFVINEPD